MTQIPIISHDTSSRALSIHRTYALDRGVKADPGSEDDIRFSALAMAGEAGEAANIVKKGWRDGRQVDREKLAEEIAGTACYLVGLAAAIGLDLDAEMQKQMDAIEMRYVAGAERF